MEFDYIVFKYETIGSDMYQQAKRAVKTGKCTWEQWMNGSVHRANQNFLHANVNPCYQIEIWCPRIQTLPWEDIEMTGAGK